MFPGAAPISERARRERLMEEPAGRRKRARDRTPTSTGSPRMHTARPFALQGTAWPPHARGEQIPPSEGHPAGPGVGGRPARRLFAGRSTARRFRLGHVSRPLHRRSWGPTKGMQARRAQGRAHRRERRAQTARPPLDGSPGMHQRSTPPFGAGLLPRAAKTSERGDIPPGRCVGGRAGPVALTGRSASGRVRRRRLRPPSGPFRRCARPRATRAGSAGARARGRSGGRRGRRGPPGRGAR